MYSRPILRQNRGPATAPAADPPATGGDNLGVLIAQADALRKVLGYQRWADLTSLCDGNDPKTLDQRGLVKLIGQLGAMQREGRRHG
ncbi:MULTISPECIES: hypothetical protein [Cyanophyceae]|uniref:hypothetical protein n=1 Tax=Cyanophyceae TaxID=3028117 RepID=UPI001681E758|nr:MULTISPECIES: hypothetical protein [Cyanophyceae]MBD1917431.1 hypothetical protein [Phormidium sp. FACHB-77]MBD2032324.1 hypothetical protein [Phormidium sp. FACHB-322]MBD2052262.1 hypothetical protein [Leptolyngbya sp. FACHB-60]